MEILLSVSWVSVLVATALSFVLGWLWYAPVPFGKKWMVSARIDPNNKKNMGLAMAAQLGSTFLFAWTLAVVWGIGAPALAVLIILLASGLVKANALFAQKGMYAVFVESSYVLAMGAMIVSVLYFF